MWILISQRADVRSILGETTRLLPAAALREESQSTERVGRSQSRESKPAIDLLETVINSLEYAIIWDTPMQTRNALVAAKKKQSAHILPRRF